SVEALPDDALPLDIRGGRVLLERRSGGLVRATAAQGVEFLAGAGGRGLLRVAAPLRDYPSHYVELGTHGTPEIREEDGTIRLVHERLATKHATLDIAVEVELEPCPEGLVMRARIRNGSYLRLPQVAFPQLLGLMPVGGVE